MPSYWKCHISTVFLRMKERMLKTQLRCHRQNALNPAEMSHSKNWFYGIVQDHCLESKIFPFFHPSHSIVSFDTDIFSISCPCLKSCVGRRGGLAASKTNHQYT